MMALLRHLALVLALAFMPALGVVGTAIVAVPGAAHAQQPPSAPDYDAWNNLAGRAADAIENQRASLASFEALREQLAEWRSVFANAESINSSAISTLEAQIRALGPAPADGESEGADIASQREALNKQLSELRAPVRQAELAYSEADEMIRNVDRIIRERQAEEFLERGPSPLNPANWSDGLSALYTTFENVRAEMSGALYDPVRRSDVSPRLPAAIVLGLIGLILLVRGRFWAEFLVRLIMPKAVTSGKWLIRFVMSLGEILMPFIGVLLMVQGYVLSGFLEEHSARVLDILLTTVLIFLVARWLAQRLFPREDDNRLLLRLEASDRKAGRLYGGLLGVIIAVMHFIRELADGGGWSPEARVVMVFPVMVLAGLLLIRLSRILAKHYRSSAEDAEDAGAESGGYRSRIGNLFVKLLVAVAIGAPLLASIGYYKAAVGLLIPSLLSLMLLAVILVLRGVVVEIYVLATRKSEGSSDDLFPMLAGFVLALMSLPFFALAWGARVADLSELWVRFKRGVTLGDLTISPTIFLTFAVVFAIGFLITRLLQGTLKNSLLPKTRMEMGARDAIVSGVGYIGIFLASLIAVTSAGIDLSSLAIVAGALSVGIGFGLQNIVSNFVSGIILLIERPIGQGDWIEVNGQHGTVREISVRSTRIETFDRSDLIIPNSDLVSGVVTNYTKGSTVGRVIVKVGVARGTDTRRVEAILHEVATAHPMVLMNPEPTILFRGFGTDSYDFEIRAILRDVNFIMNVGSDMNHEIAKRFDEEGIVIPFQQRDIWLRNPEALTGASKGDAQSDAAGDRNQTREDGAEKVAAQGPTKAQEAQRMDDADGAGGAGGDGR
ncbi:Small-conductance mechanosensitive channel [Roseovarius nanhaiticus]|uniref:Small-conductance mechanosensitive channel n=1 Tax=Roseovarius nanhaiticus TaxID=573024 RepID=A0A1N7GV08_9RHOB|nr:DUF3772 domain-containing protein [Roseovarius nanhaiticus]SEL31381.1 Small-conductance mechanosensitive channel [Roseovarius nanhaiticus]SIS16431.1 Small-conductance mechanosensitive channel [Roseovarius nanhaiticus]